MVGYTSGTTAEPKGVVHTHRSLLFEIPQLAALAPNARPMLNASPLAHMTGMLASLLLPVYRHHDIHLTDQWDPQEALRIIMEADVSAGAGATIFLTSLLDHPGSVPSTRARIVHVGLGGAPVPGRGRRAGRGPRDHRVPVVRLDRAPVDHRVFHRRAPREAQPHRRAADARGGDSPRGVDSAVDGDGGADDGEVSAGEPGEILSRGPDLFAGYTDPALTARSVTADGWYRTGDVGVLDDDGYLTITDRVSDIIIRGGANISAAEIEEALMTMPAIAECAVVAAPDERMGEHALATIRLRPDASAPDLATVQAHLESAGLPKQKWVEEVRVVDDFPRTPSGKIRKFVLRDELRTKS